MLFKIWMWLGSKLWNEIVISSKDNEIIDGVLFTNEHSTLSEEYRKIKYDRK